MSHDRFSMWSTSIRVVLEQTPRIIHYSTPKKTQTFIEINPMEEF